MTAWERRWHPLRREWVVIAAHRDRRPWLGETLAAEQELLPRHDPDCAFCPGNARAGGSVRNPDYQSVFAFDNDHPCVGEDAPATLAAAPAGYRRESARGRSRVVCYSPRHDLRLAQLPVAEIDALLECWQSEYRTLGALPGVKHVLVFENNGRAVGVSNPHPHCQIYATGFVFKTIEDEARHAAEHYAEHGHGLWRMIVDAECGDGARLLDQKAHALSFVPFFARWAYECYVGPRREVACLADLEARERRDLAEVLGATLRRLDAVFGIPMPYVMALHQAPTDGRKHAGFGFHIEIHPPLRRPGLRKYLAGPEIGGGSFLADTVPEEKAAELRAAWTPEGDGS